MGRDNVSYFHVCYYSPVMYSIKKGLKWIHAGIGAGSAKAYRGFEATQQQTLLVRSVT